MEAVSVPLLAKLAAGALPGMVLLGEVTSPAGSGNDPQAFFPGLNGAGGYGAAAVVSGLLIYLITRHLPLKDKEHVEALKVVQIEHATAIKETQREHAAAIKEITSAFLAEVKSVRLEHDKELRDMHDTHQAYIAAERSTWALERTRHDMLMEAKDLLFRQTVGLIKQLEVK